MTELRRFPAAIADPVVATLGNFDGLHLGHQAILKHVRKIADERSFAKPMRTALVSFYPHPAVILGRVESIPEITPLRSKLAQLQELGIDILYLVHFTKALSFLSAKSFVDNVLCGKINVKHLAVGPDAKIGRKGEGDTEAIMRLMAAKGAQVEIVPAIQSLGKKIGSRAIREFLLKGDCEAAAQHLGRPYEIRGRVIDGEKRGRTIGFPTANICYHRTQLLPASGVYLTNAFVQGKNYSSVTNIGIRPTFGISKISVETHLLDYQGPEFYKERLVLQVRKKIRNEKKFDNNEDLIGQIKNDIQVAREYFSSVKS